MDRRLPGVKPGPPGTRTTAAGSPAPQGAEQRDRSERVETTTPMASRMLKFVKLQRAMPDKRSAEVRRRDFEEIYDEYAPAAKT